MDTEKRRMGEWTDKLCGKVLRLPGVDRRLTKAMQWFSMDGTLVAIGAE